MINEELIDLYDRFESVGTVTASISSLDERGLECYIIRQTNMGSIEAPSKVVEKRVFLLHYELVTGWGCFTLFKMKEDSVAIAKRHKEARRLLDV